MRNIIAALIMSLFFMGAVKALPFETEEEFDQYRMCLAMTENARIIMPYLQSYQKNSFDQVLDHVVESVENLGIDTSSIGVTDYSIRQAGNLMQAFKAEKKADWINSDFDKILGSFRDFCELRNFDEEEYEYEEEEEEAPIMTRDAYCERLSYMAKHMVEGYKKKNYTKEFDRNPQKFLDVEIKTIKETDRISNSEKLMVIDMVGDIINLLHNNRSRIWRMKLEDVEDLAFKTCRAG